MAQANAVDADPTRAAARGHPGRGRQRARLRAGALFMAPAFIIMALFLLVPVAYAVYVSGTNMALTGEGAASPQWIGLDNFAHILKDHGFFNAAISSGRCACR